MTILKIKNLSLAEDLVNKRRHHKTVSNTPLEADVKKIIREVQAKGDAALINFTKKYDGADLSTKGIRVSDTDIQRA